jgi:hypothetical protein
MANQISHNRWESSLLAGALAAAGTLFIFDKLASLMQNLHSLHAVGHAAPVLLAGIGLNLWIADAKPAAQDSSAGEDRL